ncbi:MBL fold metallo-hydrolase [Paenibacillus sp. HJL G12]|uniref:MBL fold metallo-hydrolase n=2 Tax=Paenibacillus dendrobii TaxID=2691084 RepID=A0A7X3INI2_9BACL|nr:MBL fold metallo-hydrolase [Paenibacillus dendrobii]MWV46798.1 MBL fold metallo-hydrolase [Paenibacillus dendrobii]
MPEITDHHNGIIQVKISMSFPLRWVNSYVLQGPEGLTIIDPGPHTPENEEEWNRAFAEIGRTISDVKHIVLTHHHPDHLGCSGWIQQQSGCKVWMSERSYQETRLMWGPDSTMNSDLPELFRSHGMPAEWTDQLEVHMNSFVPQVTPSPEVSFIPMGQHLVMGGREWMPVETAGHAPGHVSFYHEESGEILCGDAVLPQISPNVSLTPGSDPEPLQSFLKGLLKLKNLEVSTAYPGHRNPFKHFGERLEALLLHHEERLVKIEQMLDSAPATGFKLCVSLFSSKLGIHQMRFAMCETLAHTRELERRGRVTSFRNKDDIICYKMK